MARKVTVTTTDDLSGEEGASTYRFGFMGQSFEIDLSEKNAAKFRKALDPYISSARKVASTRERRGTSASTDSGRDPKKIREWARRNNMDVPTRGRIPADVESAYNAAN